MFPGVRVQGLAFEQFAYTLNRCFRNARYRGRILTDIDRNKSLPLYIISLRSVGRSGALGSCFDALEL